MCKGESFDADMFGYMWPKRRDGRGQGTAGGGNVINYDYLLKGIPVNNARLEGKYLFQMSESLSSSEMTLW